MVMSSISNQWRNFVKDLEVEVVASDMVNNQPYNEIRLSIDKMEMVRQPILGGFLFGGRYWFG